MEDKVSNSIQCPGFEAAGIAAGIKKNKCLDLGLLYSTVPATAAGLFTRNQVQAAPVILSKERVAAGTAQAVVVNSGNANCFAGTRDMANAQTMTADTAAGLKLSAEDVLVASTGVIGAPLPVDKIRAAIPELIAATRPNGFDALAEAIMTTDTVPKLVRRQGQLNGRTFTVVAVAKGAGMIRPDMATMLCFVCSDVAISAGMLRESLKKAVDRSLNRITIDGDTSTNDTVLVLANGVSGAVVQTTDQQQAFETVLNEVLMDTARQLVKDGEGVTKMVEIKVRGVQSDHEALIIADTVAHSPLVKTAFFGQDANWGRIIAAVGRAGVPIDPKNIDLYFDQVQMVKAGLSCGPDAEAQATAVLHKPEFTVTIDLNQGKGSGALLTCDFSVDYVKINADYRT